MCCGLNINKKNKYLFVLYSIINLMFITFIFFQEKNYQDAWILDGVLIPTILYFLVYSIILAIVNDNNYVAILCAFFTITLNAIPNLKYHFFYGTYDSVGHFGLIRNLLSLGFVPKIGYYANLYSDTPGMHIVISSLSLVAGIDPNLGVKFFSSTIYGIIPLLIYLFTNNIFSKKVQKYLIIASGLPIITSYFITGTTFGLILFCIFIYLLLKRHLMKENKRKYTLILMIIAFSTLFSHIVTMLSLIIFLYMGLILAKFLCIFRKAFSTVQNLLTLGVSGLLVILLTIWLTYKANFVFEIIVETFRRHFIEGVVKTPIPQRIFEIPLFDQLRVFIVKYVKDALIIAFSFAGFYVLISKFKSKNEHVFTNFYIPLFCLSGAIILVIILQFATNFGEIEYRRFLDYAMVLSPFFVGISLWHISDAFTARVRRGWAASLLFSFIIFSFILISTIQVFRCQILVPRANVLSKNLPENDYITDIRMVNTVYQKKLISFAENFSPEDAIIAADIVTRWQITGFASEGFLVRVLWDSPLTQSIEDKSIQWDICLLHYPGKAGPLSEKVEFRTNEVINKFRNNMWNTVYDNGGSFIISKP